MDTSQTEQGVGTRGAQAASVAAAAVGGRCPWCAAPGPGETPWSLLQFCWDLSSVDNDVLHEVVFIIEVTQHIAAALSLTINPPILMLDKFCSKIKGTKRSP